MRQVSLVFAVVAIAMLVAACSGGSAVDLKDLPDGVSPAVLIDISEFQQQLLSDGEVTFSEYEEAVFATMRCLTRAGIWVSDPMLDAAGSSYRFDFGGAYTEAEGEEMENTYEKCYREFQDAVDEVWAIQNGPSEEEITVFYERVLECVRAKGFDIVIDAQQPNLERVNQLAPYDYPACFEEVLDAER